MSWCHAGAPNAHSLFDRVGQSAQAVAQLARIFIGNAFAQKRLDVLKRLGNSAENLARGGHGLDCAMRRKIVTAQYKPRKAG